MLVVRQYAKVYTNPYYTPTLMHTQTHIWTQTHMHAHTHTHTHAHTHTHTHTHIHTHTLTHTHTHTLSVNFRQQAGAVYVGMVVVAGIPYLIQNVGMYYLE